MLKKTAVNGGGGPLKTLKSVYDFMLFNDLDAVEIIEEGVQIKLVRRKASTVQVAVPVPVMVGEASAPGRIAPVQHAPSLPPVTPAPAGTAVKSPMMGIFYRAPSPSSPPFCKEGEGVKSGHVICMIEAMKVFNEIKAESACTIIKYLVENGKPVKAGQDLILIQR